MFCQKCGKELDDKAIACPNCGIAVNKGKKSVFKQWWFWVIVGILVIGIASCGSGSESSAENQTTPTAQTEVKKQEPEIPAEFAEPCPVTISASMYDNIINFPELACEIQNNTDKQIAAVRLYFAPKDVYGEEVQGIFAQNNLQIDDAIAAKSSGKWTWQMLEQEIKAGDVYVYSVYFADGSEWGDRNAVSSKIKKYAMKTSVGY